MSDRLRRRSSSVAQWLRLSGTAGTPECASIRYWDRSTRHGDSCDRAPVLLVHGYAGTEHTWGPLRSALTDAGFGRLVALRYNTFRAEIHQIADWLVLQAHRSMDAAGASGIHLIGHSMGGLVIRDAVLTRGLAGLTKTAVTIATPHAGTRMARFVPGQCPRQMRPGSEFLAGLRNGRVDDRTRWVSVLGGADRVVPESTASFDAADLVTVRASTAGHGSITRHPEVITRIVAELLRSEQVAARSFSLAACSSGTAKPPPAVPWTTSVRRGPLLPSAPAR